MRQSAARIVTFFLLAATITLVWWYADKNWFPKKDQGKKAEEE